MSSFTTMEPIEVQELNKEDKTSLDRMFYQCFIMLGGSSIPVHLEDIDFVMAFDKALKKYRAMSERSVVQTYGCLELKMNVQAYVLNKRIDLVQKVLRQSSMGMASGQFEPFYAGFVNSTMNFSGGGVGGANSSGGLVTYELMMEYQNMVGKLFGREIHFLYRNETNTLIITQVPKQDEVVALRVSILKTIGELLNDHWAHDWLQEYTLAHVRVILGEKYSLFGSLPGAQGGTTLKGEQLKQQGHQDMKELEQRLLDWADGQGVPLVTRG